MPKLKRTEVKKTVKQIAPIDDVDAFTVDEFCKRNRFSVQAFYKHRSKMPKTFNIGTRVLISKEAAAEWRHEQEEKATATV